MGSLQDCHGTVRVLFVSVGMGMGIELHGVDRIIHYGAPSSIEGHFQASGRRGQSGDSTYSIVYWTPKDCQTGDWIAKKKTRSSSSTASTTRSSPVLKEAELICCCFL